MDSFRSPFRSPRRTWVAVLATVLAMANSTIVPIDSPPPTASTTYMSSTTSSSTASTVYATTFSATTSSPAFPIPSPTTTSINQFTGVPPTSCVQQGGTIIRSSADLEALSACTTYTGNITFSGYTVSATPTLDISPLQSIVGSLTFEDVSVSGNNGFSINAPNLASVSDGLSFIGVTDLIWSNWTLLINNASQLPPTISYTNVIFYGTESIAMILGGYADSMVSVILSNNTNIGSLTINTKTSSPYSSLSLVATNNPDLANIILSPDFGGDITVSGNSDTLAVDLQSVSSSTFLNISNASSFTSDGLLSLDSAIFAGNYFTALNLPSALTAAADLAILSNTKLTALSFPTSLNAISTLSIVDNNDLSTIDLGNVHTVDQLAIVGPVDSFTAPTYLSIPTASITVQNPGTYPCASLSTIIGPNAACTVGAAPVTTQIMSPGSSHSGTAPSTSTGTGPAKSTASKHPSSSGLSSAAKIGVGVGVGIGGALILLALAIFCVCGRRRHGSSHRQVTTKDFTDERKERASENAASYGSYNPIPLSPPKQTMPSATTFVSSEFTSEPRDRLGGSNRRSLGAISTESGEQRGSMEMQEMEEQQRERYEMDARSLQDIDINDGEGSMERRSLEDIERIHNRGR